MGWRRRQKGGQALVEFAVSLPLLLLMFFGLADYGLLLYAHVQVSNATREGARAGSIYLANRFYYTSCGNNCPAGFGMGGACWSLRDWVENALAERERLANGCDDDDPRFDTTNPVHSFGYLNPANCPSATGGSSCWWLDDLAYYDDPANTPIGTTPTSPLLPGRPLEVRVRYRYNVLFFGDFIPIVRNPVTINKTVIMKIEDH